MVFEVGATVKIDNPNGSYGIVEAVRIDGPFKEQPRYYVRFHYGLDKKGEPITILSGLLYDFELISVPEEEFWSHAKKRVEFPAPPTRYDTAEELRQRADWP